MTQRDEERLCDIAEAIVAIRAYAADEKLPSPLVTDATLYRLIVIGEAVRALSDQMKKRTPDVPWPDIVGMRDILTHAYFRIDKGVVEQVVERDLPRLEAAVSRLLAGSQRVR